MKASFDGQCSLCDDSKIVTSQQLRATPHWERNRCIVENSNGSHELYYPCDDYFYDFYMDLNYCPECGRKL